MKIQSKRLHQYLLEQGVLDGSPEEIGAAKIRYRRNYKKQWKQEQQLPFKEVRPCFTLKEYSSIKAIAKEAGFKNATAFAKQLVLSSAEGQSLIPNKDVLLSVLQHIGMAVTTLLNKANPHMVETQLLKAEEILLNYLRINQYEYDHKTRT
jgi:hypothetical protein